jgi:regulator of replication initiation timing
MEVLMDAGILIARGLKMTELKKPSESEPMTTPNPEDVKVQIKAKFGFISTDPRLNKMVNDLLDDRDKKISSLESANARLEAENEVLREHILWLTKVSVEEENACLQVIDERDHREEQIDAIYEALGGEEEWSNVCDRGNDALELVEALKAENESLKKELSSFNESTEKLMEDNDSMQTRLSCALEALKEATKEFDECAFHFETMGKGAFVNTIEAIRESVARWNKILTSDNQRMVERERLREAVIQAAVGFITSLEATSKKYPLTDMDWIRATKLLGVVDALEAHEKGGE